MSKVIGVVGTGSLADLVCEKLAIHYHVDRYTDLEKGMKQATDLALALDDAWHPSTHLDMEELTRTADIPWMRGFLSFGEAVVGPLVRPGKPGCSQCADKRRLIAGHDRKEMWSLQLRLEMQAGITRDPWASRSSILHVVHLLVNEVETVLKNDNSPLEEHVLLINLKTLKSSRHFFLPDPLCTICNQLPDDSEASAHLTLQSSPKISINSYRCRSIDDLKEFLVTEYLDQRTGFLNSKMIDVLSPFAAIGVNLPFIMGDEATAGRTHNYADSELTAILEGLERYCGAESFGKKAVVYDSYRNLADQALNPLDVGVHKEEQYAMPDFPFRPSNPDRQISWVWGYSLIEERPILVPKLLAYYSVGGIGGYVYETSNGCALGGSLEEAIFYGILEVVERDAFLMTWYAKLPLPRLDPKSTNDKELQLMIDRIKAVAGYEVHLYNATMENGIPSIWAMAKNHKQDGMNLICAAGAHLDPVKAVKSAVHELAGMMLTMDEKCKQNKAKYEQMLHDSSLVRQMDDHFMLYSLPEAEKRLQFLLDENRPLKTFDEEFKPRPIYDDLTDDLKNMLQVFKSLSLNVIVVNQTAPELKRNGLHCVKVLIPGMLPMTFGHHLTRVTGLKRVLDVPMKLGYYKQPLTIDQLNPYPHPFP